MTYINKEKLEQLIKERRGNVRTGHKHSLEIISYILALDWVLLRLKENKDLRA